VLLRDWLIRRHSQQMRNFMAMMDVTGTRPPTQYTTLSRTIFDELQDLDTKLTQAIDPLPDYFRETRAIYAAVREIESSAPRPRNPDGSLLRGPQVDPNTPELWRRYREWQAYMSKRISQQGTDTTTVIDRLPQTCQIAGKDGAPATGLWLPSARLCKSAAGGSAKFRQSIRDSRCI
jgi:hypothetical protein